MKKSISEKQKHVVMKLLVLGACSHHIKHAYVLHIYFYLVTFLSALLYQQSV